LRNPSFFDPRLSVVILYELADRTAHVISVSKDPAVDCLLFERSIEASGDPIGLRLLHKRKAGLDAPKSHLLDEVIREILTAVIHQQPQAPGHIGGRRPVLALHALADRFYGQSTHSWKCILRDPQLWQTGKMLVYLTLPTAFPAACNRQTPVWITMENLPSLPRVVYDC
jgi:hypothetical protein